MNFQKKKIKKYIYLYHNKLFITINSANEKIDNYIKQRAVMEKLVDQFSGKLCYFYNFSITDIYKENIQTIINIKENLNSHYQHLYFTENNNAILKEIKTTENFLYGEGLHFHLSES